MSVVPLSAIRSALPGRSVLRSRVRMSTLAQIVVFVVVVAFVVYVPDLSNAKLSRWAEARAKHAAVAQSA